jgi:hypothetical protein
MMRKIKAIKTCLPYLRCRPMHDAQRPGICAVGDFIYSSPPATVAEGRTKVQNMLCRCVFIRQATNAE